MPALQLFGKKTMLSGDDLRTMAIFIFLFRLAQFTLALPVLISLVGGAATDDWQDVVECCRDAGDLSWTESHSTLVMHLFISFSLTMSTTGMAVAVGFYVYSGKGTPTDAKPRQPIVTLCYVHMTFYHVLRGLSFAFGIISAEDLDEYCDCRRNYNLRFSDDPQEDSTSEDTISIRDHCDHMGVWLTCYVALIITHWIDVVYAVASVIYFSRKYIPKTNQKVVTKDRTCRLCCRCCFVQLSCMTCCQYGGREAMVGDLTDFSLIMKNYMDTGGHLDVTPTDILAAIYTLKRVHVQEHLESKEKFMEEESTRLSNELSAHVTAIVEASSEFTLQPEESSPTAPDPTKSRSTDTPKTWDMDEEEDDQLTSDIQKEEVEAIPSSVLQPVLEDQANEDDEETEHSLVDKSFSSLPRSIEKTAAMEEHEISFETILPKRPVATPGKSYRQQSRKPNSSRNLRRASMTMADLQKMDSFRHSRRSVFGGGPKNTVPDHNSWAAPQETVTFVPNMRNRGNRDRRRAGFNKRMSIIPTYHAETRGSLDLDEDHDRFVLAEGARFIHHAEAIYTWSMWPTKQARDLIGLTYLAKAIDERHPDFVEWINDIKAWLKVAPIPGVTPKDVIYASFRKSLTATPYCVLIDHAWKSVVITIRGSMSLEDMLTDLTMVPAELDEVGERLGFDGYGRFCHRGILTRVEWIYNDLTAKGILDTVYGADQNENPAHEYRLRVCGHSLGAGCAAILTRLLKPKYSRVRCIAYSPPGCSVSEQLSQDLEDYVTSHILDTDVVGRTTIGGMTQLRDEMLEVIARIRIPKYRVMGSRKGRDKAMSLKTFNDIALTPVDQIPPSKYYDEVKAFFEYHESKREETRELFENELFPPGKIVQFFRTVNLREKKAFFGRSGQSSVEDDTDTDQAYSARWAKKEDFLRVILSSHFLSDHETTNVKGQIHLLAVEAGLEEPFNSVLNIEP